jgi:DNA repair protein RecN (Recombination protein N)
MLLNLSIKNFILIESLNLELHKGFCCITGETGAGKSILLDSILFVLGEKFDTPIVKAQAEYASVTAEFAVTKELSELVKEYGIELEGTILIKRQQYSDNKKKFFINDEPVTQKLVCMIATKLVEMHGQHVYSGLLNPNEHLKILDNFGDLEVDRNAVSTIFSELQKITSDIEIVNNNRDRIVRDIDYLSFVVSELQKKCPKIGEEIEIADLRINMQKSQKNHALLDDLKSFFADSNLLGKISTMQKMVDRTSGDQGFVELSSNLEQVQIYLKEAEENLAKLDNNNDMGDLEKIETRLFEIRELSRKYNMPSDELENYLHKSQTELEQLQLQMDNSEVFVRKLNTTKAEYMKLANILTEKRIEAAGRLEKRIQDELKPLKMEYCKWKIEISQKNEIGHSGMDNVRFVASTNPGMQLSPIDKIASGGEIARLMLAVKLALFDKTPVDTIIFDEIDTGIGGAVASSIGDRLLALSKVAQTIVITHQPQVAAKADCNILVVKHTDGINTKAQAKILDNEEKKVEIARMLSGANITHNSIAAAGELINT